MTKGIKFIIAGSLCFLYTMISMYFIYDTKLIHNIKPIEVIAIDKQSFYASPINHSEINEYVVTYQPVDTVKYQIFQMAYDTQFEFDQIMLNKKSVIYMIPTLIETHKTGQSILYCIGVLFQVIAGICGILFFIYGFSLHE